MSQDPPPLMFDLVADDPSQYRSLAEAEWATLQGKRNRIAIGTPLCVRERAPRKGGLLTPDDLRTFPEPQHEIYRLSLALTLLPDEHCRFRSADLLLELGAPSGQPLFVRLSPKERTTKRAVKRSISDNAKLAVKDPIFELIDTELGATETVETEIEQVEAHLASFGAGTRSAGWRFRLTESREIPLSSTGLEALVALPQGQRGKVRFRVAAQIEVETALDRWLTRLFLRPAPPDVAADYEFP